MTRDDLATMLTEQMPACGPAPDASQGADVPGWG